MKRVFGIILLLALTAISVSACSNDTTSITDKNESEKDDLQNRNRAVIRYLCFEDLLEKTTDLIEGIFVSRTETEGLYYYEFTATKNLRGNGVGKTVTVQSQPADCSIIDTHIRFSTYDMKYEPGKTYLLLLSRSSSVYTDGDVFSFVNDSLIIPLNQLNIVSEKQEILLYGTRLTEHLHSQEAITALQKGNFNEFIIDKIKNNPLSAETDYIASTNVDNEN